MRADGLRQKFFVAKWELLALLPVFPCGFTKQWMKTMGTTRYTHLPLAHRRVMVLEDDYLVRNHLEAILEKAGAMISSVYHPRLEAAILDVGIERGPSPTQIARELSRRNVPFFFYTGQPDDVLVPIRAEWPETVVVAKPAPPEAILKILVDLLTASSNRLAGLGKAIRLHDDSQKTAR